MKTLSKRHWILIGVVAALFAGSLSLKGILHSMPGIHTPASQEIYFCPMHPTYTSDRPGNCPICHMALVKREAEQHDGHEEISGVPVSSAPRTFTVEEILNMKPGEICLLHKCTMGQCMIAMTEEFARLGKCPHCGEDLGIVIREAMPEGYANVRLTEAKEQVIGIKTVSVEKKPITKTIRAVGTIAHDPELYQAQAEYLEAVKAREQTKTGGISGVLEQAERLVQSSRLRLKYLGLSDEIIEEIGRQAGPDQSLLFGQAGEAVWVYAKIYEYELPFVKVGQEVEIEIPSLGTETLSGQIKAIDTAVDSATRTLQLRIRLDNLQGVLKPNMFVNVVILSDLGEVLAVPKEAVFDTGTRKIIFVDKGQGVFEPREVRVGVRTETHYEVLSGLVQDERVVVSGNFLIDSESRLRGSLENAAGGHSH